jgi:glycosyltransferase involved in cell wall biosynthesis
MVFHGPVDDVVSFYQASDVVVWPGRPESWCPSGNGTPVLQVGFPRCIIEPAACGRPLVLTETPGVDEAAIRNETGVFVRPEDPSDMADAVIELLRDTNRREAMGAAARRLAESRFGIEQHGQLITKVYQSTIAAWPSQRREAGALGSAIGINTGKVRT